MSALGVAVSAAMALKATSTILTVAGSIPELFQSMGSDSLVEYTQPARMEPMAIISNDIRDDPAIPECLQTFTSVISGYYLLGVAMSSAFGDVKVMRTLEKLNPNRSTATSLGIGLERVGSMEAYHYSLPNYGAPVASMEADAISFGKSISDIRLAENLACGKMLEVSFRSGENTVVIPVVVRVSPVTIATTELKNVLGLMSNKNTVKERYHRMRAGELSFIGDFLLCNDLIEEHKKTSMRDKSGFYMDYINKRRKNKLAAIASGTISVGTASNMLIMSDVVAKDVEAEIGGKLSDPRTRQQIFERTGLIIMAILEPAWGRVTFYTRSIKDPMQLSVREMKSMNKTNGPDINDILKAFMAGNAPTL